MHGSGEVEEAVGEKSFGEEGREFLSGFCELGSKQEARHKGVGPAELSSLVVGHGVAWFAMYSVWGSQGSHRNPIR